MSPALVIPLLRLAGFSSIRTFPRAQFQVAEKEGTGGIIRFLRPLIGSAPASFIKTIKNSLFIRNNGVVWAKK